MPGAIHGQPPAKGTLGFVVYFPDSVFFVVLVVVSHPRPTTDLVSLLFNLAFILPLPTQHSDSLVAALPHVRLHYPEVSSCPWAARTPAISFGLRFPEGLRRSASLYRFQDHNSRRLQFHDSCLFTLFLLELAGLQPARRRAVTTCPPVTGHRVSSAVRFPPYSVTPFAGRRGWPER